MGKCPIITKFLMLNFVNSYAKNMVWRHYSIIFYLIGLEGMLEEEVEALQVGFEKGVWAKPFFGMEIFDEDSPFCEEYFFKFFVEVF